jgi:hypothetical protein
MAIYPPVTATRNLRRTITYYEAALRIYTERDFPQDWATTQNNLRTVRNTLKSRS